MATIKKTKTKKVGWNSNKKAVKGGPKRPMKVGWNDDGSYGKKKKPR